MAQTPVLIVDAKAALGEGAIWNAAQQELYWINIEGKELHVYRPATNQDIHFSTPTRPGTVVPYKKDEVLIALQNGIHRMNTATGKLTFIIDPIQDSNIRFNDGKCDPAGRFWVGTMHLQYHKGAAVLYRMDRDGSVHQMLDSVTISNGIVWSQDKKTMYYIDTPTGTVEAFDYNDATGNISNRRVVVTVPPGMGSPDGMTIDSNGNLWTAMYGGYAVICWNPATGKMIQKIEVPAPNVTSCAFGGSDLKTLYITTARQGMKEDELAKYPAAGGLFSVPLDVAGVEAFFYKGSIK